MMPTPLLRHGLRYLAVVASTIAWPAASSPAEVSWSRQFGRIGAGKVMDAIVVGRDLYVAGFFQEVRDVHSPAVARWDGTRWHDVGGGVRNTAGWPICLATFGPDLIVGGSLDGAGAMTVREVARFDGTDWHPMGDDLHFPVRVILVHEGQLLVGGSTIGPTRAELAYWTGAEWDSLTTIDGLSVLALGEYRGDLIVGGDFDSVDGVPAANVARFDGAQWHTLGAGVDGVVHTFAVHEDRLWVGGRIPEAGGMHVRHVVAWNGSTWEARDEGIPLAPDTVVEELLVQDGRVLAALSAAGDASHLLEWSGTAWTPVPGPKVPGDVLALAVYGDSLVVGGDFPSIGDLECDGLATRGRLEADWSVVGTGEKYGLEGSSVCFAEHDGLVYVGGGFTSAGSVGAPNILAWNGQEPWPLGEGLDSVVRSMVSHDGRLIAGGSFGASGTTPLARIAAWDGASWQPLGDGLDDEVRALVVHEGELYAGGRFRHAGGSAADRIARWDGESWHAVGAGFSGPVYSLASWRGELWAGGSFTFSGEQFVSHVARWNGVDWESPGRGVDGWVSSILPRRDELVVGGYFAHAGGVPADQLAAWDGDSWNPIEAPEWDPWNHWVEALAEYHGDLIVAPAGDHRRDVARQEEDGSWTIYSTARVTTAFAHGEDLYLGGSLRYTGPVASYGWARMSDRPWDALAPGEHRRARPSPSGPFRIDVPFRAGAGLFVTRESPGPVTLDIFDVAGRSVARAFEGWLPAGDHRLSWDATTRSGAPAAAGIYLIRLRTPEGDGTGKLVLVR
jgi:hypothetical protein